MATAGYAAKVLVSSDTATTFTAEAMTGSGAGPYTITNTAKAIWDPAQALTFYDNGVAISSGDILSVDLLLGKVTFTSSKTGPITVSGKYFITYEVTDGSEVSFELMRDQLDTTVFGASGYKSRILGLLDAKGTIHLKNRIDIDYDSSGATRKFAADLTAGTPFVLSLRPTGTGTAPRYRMWVYATKTAQNIAVDGLVEGDIDFECYAQTSVGGYPISVSFIDT